MKTRRRSVYYRSIAESTVAKNVQIRGIIFLFRALSFARNNNKDLKGCLEGISVTQYRLLRCHRVR